MEEELLPLRIEVSSTSAYRYLSNHKPNQNITMRNTTITAIAFAILLAVAPMAASAAAPTVDSETTSTTKTSDITGTTVLKGFNANASNFSIVSVEADSLDAKIEIRQNATGRVVYSNSSMALDNETTSDSTIGNFFSANVTHDELKDVERSAGETVSLDLRIINNSTLDNPDTTNVTFDVENTNEETVEVITASEQTESGLVSIEEKGRDYIFANTTRSESETDHTADINDTNTTVTYVFADDATADTLLDAESRTATLSSGDWFILGTGKVQGELVKTYYKSHSVESGTNETYAIFSPSYDDGQPAVTFHYDSAAPRFGSLDGRTTIDHTILGNKAPGIVDSIQAFGFDAWKVAFAG